MEMHRLAEAESAFRECADLAPLPSVTASQVDTVHIFSLWHASGLARRRGAAQEALPLLERLTQKYPQVLEGWLGLGQVLSEFDRRREAETAFARGVQLQPKALFELHRDRLENLRHLGDADRYSTALRDAQLAFPSKPFPNFLSAPIERATPLVSGTPSAPTTTPPFRTHSPSENAPLLSLCMIVRNEEKNLGPCLESVRGLVDEIIVVDTGSQDRTREIAQSAGARVFDFPWINDFSAARNQSLDAAKGRWILWLDADDRIEAEQRQALRSAVQQADRDPSGPKAFGIVVKNSGDGGKTGTVFNQIRIFPARSELRFTGRVHEQILPAIESLGMQVEYWPWRVLHTGYADPSTAQAKQIRNRELLEAQIKSKDNVTPITLYTLGMAYLDLGEFEAALSPLQQAESLARAQNNNPHVVAQVPVKKAVALAALGRYNQALEALPQQGNSSENPEATLVRGQILESLGQEDEARIVFESLLDLKEGPSFIPVDIGMIKLKSLKFLGSYYQKRGNSPLALQLLKQGLALRDGQDFDTQAYLKLAYHSEVNLHQ
jgi:glycosyltransferase involved in cell wall biosynthesis